MQLKVDRVHQSRRLTKTLLQSKKLAEEAKLYYITALREAEEELEKLDTEPTAHEEKWIRKTFDKLDKDIKRP